jgi:hypothetical protein
MYKKKSFSKVHFTRKQHNQKEQRICTQSTKMHFQTLTLSLLFTSTLASPLQSRACTGPNVNAATVSLIKEFEGFVARPAPDPIGLPTVGYGHLCQTSGCGEVPYSFPLTTSTASLLLASDLKVRPTYPLLNRPS